MRNLLLVIALLSSLVISSRAFGAVVTDATSSATFDGSVSAGSWNHTITGTNVTIVCSVSMSEVYGGFTPTSFTYNSVNLTPAGSATNSVTGIQLSYAVAPVTGTHLAAYTAANGTNVYGACVSFTGADQTTPVGTASTGTNLSVGVGSVTVPANGLALEMGYQLVNPCDSLAAASSGQTQLYNLCADVAIQTQIVGSTRATTGTFTWSGIVAFGQMGQVAVPINPVSATAAVARRRIINQ
jgi:hypothetical protein